MEPGGGMVLESSHASKTIRVIFLALTKFF